MMMKTLRKGLTALVLALAMTLTLTACDLSDFTGGGDDFDPAGYMQGYLDAMYHGDFNTEWMEKHEWNQSEVEELYLNNLDVEAETFLYCFSGADDPEGFPTEELKDQVIELYKKIYAKADYTIVSCTEQSDGSYAVKLTVRPLDIIQLMYEGFEDWYTEFLTQYADVDTEAMSTEEFTSWYTAEVWPAYVQSLIDYANSLLPNMSTTEERSTVLQFEQVDEDNNTIYYDMNSDDFNKLDQLLVDYTQQ